MVKKGKKEPKNAKNKKNINKTQTNKTNKKNKKEKKVTKENIKKPEKIKEKEKEENEEENIEKILEKINKVKYLNVNVGNDGNEEDVEIFTEKGEKIDPFDDKAPLCYCNFHFTVDVDTGQILDWSKEKLYAKVNVRAIDTGSFDYFDKDNNKIYEEAGYVPDFLGITSPAYGDDICFNTDVNGFILDWKEKKIKEQIINHLRKYLLHENDYY